MVKLTGQALEALKAGDPFLKGALPGAVRRDPSDASIGTGNFTQGAPAFWFARSVEYGSAENLYTPYADSPWVRSAIQKIAQPISSCELLFTRPSSIKVRAKRPGMKQLSTARGIIYRAEAELLDLPQIMQWLKEPVRDLSYQDFVEASVGWLKMQEAFWVMADKTRMVPFPEVANGFPQITIARPDRMRPDIEDGEIVGWTFTKAGGRTLKLDPTQVVRLRGWNPYDDYRGLGDYRAAHIAAEADWLAGKFSRNLMANNGDTSRIISVKNGQPSDTQRAQLIAEFRARREASLRGQNRDVVVGGDVELHNAELASVDPSFISQRLENRHEVYIAFGVPPSMADIKASYSTGSASDMFQLLTNTCIPTGAKYCGALEKLIFMMTGERVEAGLSWDEHPCMQEVRKERLDIIAKLAAQGMPVEAINEYLALGLVKYPGWEIGYIPINIQPVLNEAGEVNPAPTPGDFSEPPEENEPGNPPEPDGDETPEPVKEMLSVLRNKSAAERKPSEKNKKLWEAHMRLRSKAVKQYQGKISRLLTEYRATALSRLYAVKNLRAFSAPQISSESKPGTQAEASSASHECASPAGYSETSNCHPAVAAGAENHGRNPAASLAAAISPVTKSLVDVLFDAAAFVADLTKRLDPVARGVMQAAGEELFAEIGQADNPWKMAPQTALRFIKTRDKLLSSVGETAQSQLNTALSAGLDKGETVEQLAARVKGVFNNLSNNEARRIAMTETSAAYGFSRHEAMTDAGIEYKAWLTSGGDNVRAAHEAAGAEYGPDGAIPIDDPFFVDGEALMYPGDNAGSAGNVINCHCVQIAARKPKEE
jgi:hypothetical protein